MCLMKIFDENILTKKGIFHSFSIKAKKKCCITTRKFLSACIQDNDDDDQPKLIGSGVVATLVCEYPKDPDPIFQYLDTNRD